MLVERIKRKSHSKGGIWVPRRDQEETPFAKVYHPGKTGYYFGIKQGDTVLVRAHCGHDFVLEGTKKHPEPLNLTFLNYDKDEIHGIVEFEDELSLDDREGY